MNPFDYIEPYKGREVNPDLKTEVYRNLNRKDGVYFSIRQKGLVVGHSKKIILTDCTFKIEEAGRKKALETRHKNVHAYVKGYLTDQVPLGFSYPLYYDLPSGKFYTEIEAEVRKCSCFYVLDDKQGAMIQI